MVTQEYQTMSRIEKPQSSSMERKLYPLTGEVMAQAEQEFLENWDQELEEARERLQAKGEI